MLRRRASRGDSICFVLVPAGVGVHGGSGCRAIFFCDDVAFFLSGSGLTFRQPARQLLSTDLASGFSSRFSFLSALETLSLKNIQA
jgi:hypothetical protein